MKWSQFVNSKVSIGIWLSDKHRSLWWYLIHPSSKCIPKYGLWKAFKTSVSTSWKWTSSIWISCIWTPCSSLLICFAANLTNYPSKVNQSARGKFRLATHLRKRDDKKTRKSTALTKSNHFLSVSQDCSSRVVVFWGQIQGKMPSF